MVESTGRIDAFTDAAFAFAVTLMVAGVGSNAPTFADLRGVVASAPSFLIGFAIIAMFWLTHVRWRTLRGRGDWRGVMLTLALVFAVLLYVHPLRAMAASFANFLSGQPDDYGGHIADMFAIYGIGFTAMSLIVVMLFLDARRAHADGAERREATGQAMIWAIAAITGVVATLLTRVPGVAVWAPFAYATLPISIGIFASRYRWLDVPVAKEETE